MRQKRFVFNANFSCGHIAFCTPAIHLWDYPEHNISLSANPECSASAAVAVIVFEVLMAICIVTGNLLILYIMSTSTHFEGAQGLIKTSLAASDFLVGAVILPTAAVNKMMIVFKPLGESYLRYLNGTRDTFVSSVLGTLFSVCMSASLFSLLLLAVDRLLAVHWPLRYSQGDLMTRKLAKRLVIATWCLSLVLGILPLGDRKRFSYNIDYMTMSTMLEVKPNPKHDPPTVTHGIFFLVLVFLLPYACVVVVTTVTWVQFLIARKRSCCKEKPVASAKLSANGRVVPPNSDLERVTRTIFIMVVVFSICVVPFLAVQIENLCEFSKEENKGVSRRADPQKGCNPVFYLVAVELLFANSLSNFIIYNLRNELFREELMRIVTRRAPKQATSV